MFVLVGHHSERHARRDQERIENGMRRAVRLWETSEYWSRRAAGGQGRGGRAATDDQITPVDGHEKPPR